MGINGNMKTNIEKQNSLKEEFITTFDVGPDIRQRTQKGILYENIFAYFLSKFQAREDEQDIKCYEHCKQTVQDYKTSLVEQIEGMSNLLLQGGKALPYEIYGGFPTQGEKEAKIKLNTLKQVLAIIKEGV